MVLPEQSDRIPSLLASNRYYSSDGRVKDSMDVHESIEALKRAMQNVTRRIVGRDRLVEQTLVAMLSREHQLIFSRTGTAKTLYGKTVFGQFDAETFFIQFTKGTTEEALVGAYDLSKFKKGTVWHDTEHTLVTADFAFLDEFYDANDMVLRSMLGILNEKEFSKGKQYQRARLHTAIAVTNYLRQSELSEAVRDRFLYQAHLNPDNTPLDQLLIDRVYDRHNGRVVPPEQPLPMSVPADLAKVVKGENPRRRITAPYSLLFLKDQVIRKFADLVTAERQKTDSKAERLYISPRTVAKSRDVLNASALLNHRFEVTVEDLVALRFIITTISGNDRGDNRENDIRTGSVNQEDVFFQAIDETLASFSTSDLQAVEQIMTINEYLEATHQGLQVEALKTRRPNLLKQLYLILGITSWENATPDTFRASLTAINVQNCGVSGMRDGLIHIIDKDVQRN